MKSLTHPLLFLACLILSMAPSHAIRMNIAGVTIIREGITTNQSGTSIDLLKVYLPAGLNVATEPFSRRTRPCATFHNVPFVNGTLPNTLQITRINLDAAAAAGPIYPLPDRIPVRFEANSITWTPATGSFVFNTSQELQYRDELQLLLLQSTIFRNLPGSQAAASNGLYYLACKSNQTPCEFRTRPNGAATLHSLDIALDPFKFGNDPLTIQTHFPELTISWNEESTSHIQFTNDEINRSSSGLAGADPTLITYGRGKPPRGCEGAETPEIPTDDIICGPDQNRWRFTRDGGLHAECSLLQDLGFTGTTLEWMGYWEGDTLRFGQQITTRFTSGRLMTGGIHIRDDILNLPPARRLGGLTHSGHSLYDLVPGTERPATNRYRDGLADYPGLNLRCQSQAHNAVSRLAGQPVPPYPLELTSKYYLRPSGVSGLHLSSSNDPINLTALGGAQFELTSLRLSFLDGENIFSGVDGSMTILYPSDFTVAFEQLLFGPQGQFESATIAPEQEGKVLAAWFFEFDPLALDFPQAKSCDPPPGPGEGFPRLICSALLAGLTDEPLVGPIGFYNNNILAESDPETGGNVPISRFATSSNLSIKGPSESKYEVSPMSGIALNKFQNGNWDPSIAAGALINLPFFVDLPVVLTSSSLNLGNAPPLIVRKPWADLDTEDGFDLNHRGLPPGITFAEYRDDPSHDPFVTRDWQDLITFGFAVKLDADGFFRSRNPIVDDLFLFRFAQAVKSISPDNAELIFDGNIEVNFDDLIPQINIASLLQNSNLLDLNGGVEAVQLLDKILADRPDELLQPAITTIVSQVVTSTLLNNLQTAGSPAQARIYLENAIAQIEGEIPGLLDGALGQDLVDQLAQIRTHLGGLRSIIQTGGEIEILATQLAEELEIDDINLPDNTQLQENLESVVALIDQVISRLIEIENAFSGDALNSLLADQLNDATAQLEAAIEEIDTKWTNPFSLANANLADLEEDLTAAITENLAGSAFAATFGRVTREYLGDTRDLTRQAIDDGIRKLELLINEPVSDALAKTALGDLQDFMAGANLRGYARINGDSLHEIRVDGSTSLSVTQDQKMKFDAWFLFRSLDSATPGTSTDPDTECLKNAGVKAEIVMGAEADISWGAVDLGISAAAKIALGDNNTPIGFTADFALRGNFEMGPVALTELKLGVGAGAGNGYFYGAASGEISLMSISAGIFVGLTCDSGVLANADPDIGAVLAQAEVDQPVAGLIVYAEGGMSLMPLIGIPPSCFLDVRIHGGQGFIALVSLPQNPGEDIQIIGGVKMLQGISGEVLCLVNVRGDLSTIIIGEASIVGSRIVFESLTGAATATLKGKVGIGFLSFTFKVMARLIISVDVSGNLDWEFDF